MKPSDPDAAKLLRWYPRPWRERYGEEFLAGPAPGPETAGRGRAGTMTTLAGILQLFLLL